MVRDARIFIYYMDLVNRCAVTLSIEIMRYLQHFQLVLDLFNIVEYFSTLSEQLAVPI